MPPEVTDDQSHAPGQAPGAGRPSRSVRRGERPLWSDDDPADHPGVCRLYSSALMAAVLDVPPAAIRHWTRGGLLEPARTAGSVEWFDFPQLVAARHLARLLGRGFSLRDIDAKLGALVPEGGRAAAEAAARVRIDGRRLSLDDGGRMLAAGRQLQLGFYAAALSTDNDNDMPATVELAPSLSTSARSSLSEDTSLPPPGSDAAEILDLADDLEAAGEFSEAAEALRAVLQAQGPSPRVMFMLAELLYRAGDLTAARERYYAVIELDPDHLQARDSLGCVLAELGEHELALAALQGVLRQEPGYADAHWHIAGVLREIGQAADADHHLQRFLDLAPESPWATLARARLDESR